MTTIADALKATLDAQWAVPTGGTEPTWYVSDDAHSPPASGIDYVLIQSYTLTTRIDAVNNTYSNKTHLIEMEVNTPTGDNRLKQLADEVERILNTVAITGVNWQKVTHRENISDKRIPFFRERVTCSLLEMLASSTGAYGSVTATTFTADHLIGTIDTTTAALTVSGAATVGTTLGVTGAATVGSVVTAGNVDGVDVSTLNTQVQSLVEDAAYGAGWNADVTHAPTQNAVYDTLAAHYADADAHHALTLAASAPDVTATAAEINSAIDGCLATFTEINRICDGVLATAAEVNTVCDGCLATAAEITSLCDGATITAAQLEDLLMFGAGNATYVPCIFELETVVGKVIAADGTGLIANVDNTDVKLRYCLPIPILKGTLKLYITGVKIVVNDADAGDYVDTVTVYASTHAGITQIMTDDTNRTAQGTYTTAVAATDVSGYTNVIVWVICVCTDALDLDIASVSVNCYYAA